MADSIGKNSNAWNGRVGNEEIIKFSNYKVCFLVKNIVRFTFDMRQYQKERKFQI